MFRDTESSSTSSRFIDTPEYRRLVYKWMRREAWMSGNIRRITAREAWRRSGVYVDVLRNAQTVAKPKGVAGLFSIREVV